MPSLEFLELIGSVLVTEEVTTTTINVTESDDVTTVTVTEQVIENPTMVVENASYEVARVTAAVGEANTIKEDTQGLYEDTVIAKDAAVDAKELAEAAQLASEDAMDLAEGYATDTLRYRNDAASFSGAAEAARDLATTTVNNSLTDITSHTEDKKVELDTYTTTKEGELDTYTTAKEGELDTHTTTKKGELDSYVLLTSKPDLDNYVLTTLKPDLDTYRVNTVQPAIDTYRTGTVEPAIDAYVDATTKPSIDAYASAQAATVVQPLVDKAEQWAEETEDVEVETGKYSAKHYAVKAEDTAAALSAAIDTINHLEWITKNTAQGCYTVVEIDAMITDGYVPIATPADFDAIRSSTTRTFGSGTPWEASYTTTGLLGKYIQVQDIDMYFDTQDPSGAYYNGGSGFPRMGGFGGIYDGGGRVISKIKVNLGIFQSVSNNGVIRNLGLEDALALPTSNWNGILCSADSGLYSDLRGTVENCFISGIKYAGNTQYVGVFFGRTENNGYAPVIKNCVSVVQMVGGNDCRYSSLITGWSSDEARNVIVLGTNFGGSNSNNPIGSDTSLIFNTYYNSDTCEVTQTGYGKLTDELYNFDETVYDGNNWAFKDYRYPILKVFGERSWNRIQPLDLKSFDYGTSIRLTWTSSFVKPTQFNIYASEWDGVKWLIWTKVGETTDYYFDYTTPPVDKQHIKFFVKGEYK